MSTLRFLHMPDKETIRYMDLLFTFCHNHPNYHICDREAALPINKRTTTMVEVYNDWFTEFNWCSFTPEAQVNIVKGQLDIGIKTVNKSSQIQDDLKEYEKKLLQKPTNTIEENWVFLTIGFNEQTITPAVQLKLSLSVLDLKYFREGSKMVLEKFRTNGEHHHTHFLLYLSTPIYTSKLIQFVFQKVKNHCLKPEFIDVLGPINKKKLHQPLATYEKYIMGDKQESKLPFIEKDKKWRAENKIQDIYIK